MLNKKNTKENTKASTVAMSVEKAIKPKYASEVILIDAFERLFFTLLSSVARKPGISFEDLRKSESRCLFVF